MEYPKTNKNLSQLKILILYNERANKKLKIYRKDCSWRSSGFNRS